MVRRRNQWVAVVKHGTHQEGTEHVGIRFFSSMEQVYTNNRLGIVDTLLHIDNPETPEGQQKVLINQLYDFNVTDLEDMLLQVVHLSVTHRHQEHHVLLKKFLLHLSSKSMILGIRLSWVVDAIRPTFQQLGLLDRVKDLTDTVESMAIQGRKLTSSRSSSLSSSSSSSPVPSAVADHVDSGSVEREVQNMQRRLALFNDERLFATQLTTASNHLRTIADRSKRKGELHRILHELNDKFLARRRVMFPLGLSNQHVEWIVRVAVEECSVFSSRERAPYSLICEVIRDDVATYGDPTSTTLFDAEGQLIMTESVRGRTSHSRTRSGDDSFRYPAAVPPSHIGVFASAPVLVATDGAASPTASSSTAASTASGGDLLSTVFGESFAQKRARLRSKSPYGGHPKWDVQCLIVKAGDDLRQEELALQIIDLFNKLFRENGLTCCVMPYAAVSTTNDAGVIQMLTDASSIDSIKKAAGVQSLHQFFTRAFGEGSKAYAIAQRNFIESMAGYSVVSFLMQIKDRHNGNLMLTRSGQLVHIDFGFMLATSPGGIKFESAPFKLSQELVDVMGGPTSCTFQYFKVLFFQGLKVARDHADEIIALVELMTPYNTIACFGPNPNVVVDQIRERFRFDLETDVAFAVYVKELISISLDNWRTKRYDQFQTLQNGII